MNESELKKLRYVDVIPTSRKTGLRWRVSLPELVGGKVVRRSFTFSQNLYSPKQVHHFYTLLLRRPDHIAYLKQLYRVNTDGVVVGSGRGHRERGKKLPYTTLDYGRSKNHTKPTLVCRPPGFASQRFSITELGIEGATHKAFKYLTTVVRLELTQTYEVYLETARQEYTNALFRRRAEEKKS